MMRPDPSNRQPRSADRFGLVLPITMEGEEGSTHDLSATGVLLESPSAQDVGQHVALKLQYRARGQDRQIECSGEVVRVERAGDSFNIAVRLFQPLFDEPG
jgi:hypothetical protein